MDKANSDHNTLHGKELRMVGIITKADVQGVADFTPFQKGGKLVDGWCRYATVAYWMKPDARIRGCVGRFNDRPFSVCGTLEAPEGVVFCQNVDAQIERRWLFWNRWRIYVTFEWHDQGEAYLFRAFSILETGDR